MRNEIEYIFKSKGYIGSEITWIIETDTAATPRPPPPALLRFLPSCPLCYVSRCVDHQPHKAITKLVVVRSDNDDMDTSSR